MDLTGERHIVLDCVSNLRLASSNCVVGFGGVSKGIQESCAKGWLGNIGVAPFHVDRTPLSTDVDLWPDFDLELLHKN